MITETYNGYKIRVMQDECAESPREAVDNLGTILYIPSRYLLGDETRSQEEIEELIAQHGTEIIWLPVFAHMHSGVSLSTTNPGDLWDSRQCGIIYCTLDQAETWLGNDMPSSDRIKEILKAEVETFSAYLSGEVYGYEVEAPKGMPETEESCWGFYSVEEAMAECRQKLFIRWQPAWKSPCPSGLALFVR